MKLKLPILFLLFSISYTAYGQKFDYDLNFKVRFDNREYKSEFSPDKTLFGLKLVPEIGVEWGDNRIMGGIDLTRHFGAKKESQPDLELILYYEYDNNRNFKVNAGIFSRDKFNRYPRAFISGSKNFYDPLVEGAHFRYYGKQGFIELICDWNGMITESEREKFVVLSSGMIQFKRFILGYYGMMHHFAGSETVRGVVDNGLIYPHVKYIYSLNKHGERWFAVNNFDSSISIGWLQAFQNDRKNENEFVTPGGFMAEIDLRWRSFGMYNTLYLGDNIMPYYERYAGELYFGDPFFRTHHGVYNRLEVFWQPRLKNGLSLKLSSIHHYEGERWNWQQMVTFSVTLNHRTIGRK